MITGTVTAENEALLKVRLEGGLRSISVDAVIDTGFNGQIALPLVLVEAIGARRLGSTKAILGDGSITTYEIYAARVLWNEQWTDVLISATGDEPVIGSKLFDGYQLRIEYRDGGAVEVTQLPPL